MVELPSNSVQHTYDIKINWNIILSRGQWRSLKFYTHSLKVNQLFPCEDNPSGDSRLISDKEKTDSDGEKSI